MRPSEVLARASNYLAKRDVESPRENAEVLLMNVLETNRAGLFTRSEGLSTAEARAFGRALCQRCTGVPLQHLTGEQAFHGVILTVRPGVFIPRPETETVVDVALGAIAAIAEPVVVDVGTGSGAIAVSIARAHPEARVVATDLSAEAVQLAEFNARRNGVSIEVFASDLVAALPSDLRGRVDLLVSNPPYVEEAEAAALSVEVMADPSLALFGGTDVHERLADVAGQWLRPGGRLVMEIGAEQGDQVEALLERAGGVDLRRTRDLAGRDRVVAGTFPDKP